MVVDGEFYFPLRDKLNDPFEFRWRDSFPKSKKALKAVSQKLIEARHSYLPPPWQKKAVEKIYSQMVEQAGKGRSITSVSTKGLTVGVYCASSICDDILMWSHYSANHTGVCVGFRPSRITDPHFFFPVSYADSVPVVDVRVYGSSDIESVVNAGLTKSTHWRYEQEWRSIWKPGLYYFPNSVDRVIIGALATNETKHAVYEAVKKAPQRIAVFRAELSVTHYKLDLHQVRVHGKRPSK